MAELTKSIPIERHWPQGLVVQHDVARAGPVPAAGTPRRRSGCSGPSGGVTLAWLCQGAGQGALAGGGGAVAARRGAVPPARAGAQRRGAGQAHRRAAQQHGRPAQVRRPHRRQGTHILPALASGGQP